MSDRMRKLIALVSAFMLLISSSGITAFADDSIYSDPVTVPGNQTTVTPVPETPEETPEDNQVKTEKKTTGRARGKARSSTKVSSTTISRVKKCLVNPEGGYRTALNRLEEASAENNEQE